VTRWTGAWSFASWIVSNKKEQRMKLKPLALTAAMMLGACTLPAQAQWDTSFYGVLDLSYGRFEPSGAVPDNRLNSNSLTATHVGFNVKYGLEGGWTPGLSLETFYRFQDLRTGRNNQDPWLSRQAFASLNHQDYGFVRLGRLQTYLFDTTNRFNALGNSVGFSPAIRHVFASGNLESVQGDFYWDEALSYTSPKLEGTLWENTTINVMRGRGRRDERGDYTAANVVWSKGVVAVALSVQDVRVDDGINDATAETAWQLGATYNLGFMRVFGTVTQARDRGLGVRSNLLSGGVSVPLAAYGTIIAQVGQATSSGLAVERKHTSISAAYVYGFNSVTDLYAIGMDDRVRGQTRGVSLAVGARYKF
jgi:predicted porin